MLDSLKYKRAADHEPKLDGDAILAQFNRLIQELLRGTMNRNTFRPWEIALLLDIEGCNLRDGAKRETLRRYQKAVQRQMDKGAESPMKLSQYLEAQRTRRAQLESSQVSLGSTAVAES